MASVPIKITNDGSVAWLAPANFEANCELNIQYYPFDQQTCSMEVSKAITILIDFSLTAKAATFIFISGCGSAISSAREGKSGFIYNLVKS